MSTATYQTVGMLRRRWLHSQLRQKPRQSQPQPQKQQPPQKNHRQDAVDAQKLKQKQKADDSKHVKRNELGVQLLSRTIRSQLFPSSSLALPSPPNSYVQISREHLSMHGLDPTQASVLPSTSFTLPPLQGNSLGEHFHRIGMHTSAPYRSLALQLADADLPPMPEHADWDTSQSGWTKYHYRNGGASFSEPVPYPMRDGKPEELLVFDVETMPKEGHPYAVIAIAASPSAWYAWISPWLLGESPNDDPAHLIPLGDPEKERVVVGHNVSFDRARLLEEYHLGGTKTRFLDTMSLHVAVNGISSHQRPAWNKYKKKKDRERLERDEAVEAVMDLVERVSLEERRLSQMAGDEEKLGKLRKLRMDMQESLRLMREQRAEESDSAAPPALDLETSDNDNGLESDPEASVQRWEDLTSANSLVDVARLHCNIDLSDSKTHLRRSFIQYTRPSLLPLLFPPSSSSSPPESSAPSPTSTDVDRDLPSLSLTDYLTYCATDVHTTHLVYRSVLPSFLSRCPHPVSLAGVLTMGSSFLPVNEGWERYLERAESVYWNMEAGVRKRLAELADEAKELASELVDEMNEVEVEGEGEGEGVTKVEKPVLTWKERKWEEDPWLSQLDWTPKKASKSRGIGLDVPVLEQEQGSQSVQEDYSIPAEPTWLAELIKSPLSSSSLARILPLILRLTYNSRPLRFTAEDGWHYIPSPSETNEAAEVGQLRTSRGQKIKQVLSLRHAATLLESGEMTATDIGLAISLSRMKKEGGEFRQVLEHRVVALANAIYEQVRQKPALSLKDPWLSQLDWWPSSTKSRGSRKAKAAAASKPPAMYWPKWYWDLTKPKKGLPPGTIDITPRNRIAPLLLRLSWRGHPLYHSREHGWCYRAPAAPSSSSNTPLSNGSGNGNGDKVDNAPTTNALTFSDAADDALADLTLRGGFTFHKLPHKDGEKANVGSPLGKTFIKYAADGTLGSIGGEAKEALELSAMCSYWMSARDRILNQLVVWEDTNKGQVFGFGTGAAEKRSDSESGGGKWGVILPQVITMGTVTRRAIEKTWLTASNAKKNRVGSELKAMVRAPPGYSIVGADVDSEELWISSCMGDAQFGMHGSTALGWMTLEGTKSAGTDLHSKTASILGLSRDQAKVFNYSRIYGAGMRHAVLLLLQANAGMKLEEAQKLAENLYASTKGKNTHRNDIFERKFWFGGSESFVFNKLEEIAMSDRPRTPALGCGVTYALSREYLPTDFGSDYMPSRINWVVQSSGVDYLHMLIVSMDYLIAKYSIQARYLISVHDELRYLVKDEDRYRAALALQVANLWTRAMFAYKLGMDDLPQGVAFFSAVDIDRVLRKEVDMPCVTPSQPDPIPSGESLGIEGALERTNGGSLWSDGGPMETSDNQESSHDWVGSLEGYEPPNCLMHRSPNAAFLRAQATQDFGEVKGLAQQVYGVKFTGGIGAGKKRGVGKQGKGKKDGKGGQKALAPVGNGEGFDWSDAVEQLLHDSEAYARAKVVIG
ncbi:hypothetical protein AX17_002008 [Amanita inopinata Kibby_2008]|nr:hypothetical protein AX17_002008 [Amanita inopinata Kibby_2008]